MRMALNKVYNEYADALGTRFYDQTPKAVFAAIAVSALAKGADGLLTREWPPAELQALVLHEWRALHENGIVPQKPPKEDLK